MRGTQLTVPVLTDASTPGEQSARGQVVAVNRAELQSDVRALVQMFVLRRAAM